MPKRSQQLREELIDSQGEVLNSTPDTPSIVFPGGDPNHKLIGERFQFLFRVNPILQVLLTADAPPREQLLTHRFEEEVEG